MRINDRIKSAIQFFAFAFHPKTTLIVCTVVSVIAIALLGWIMSVTKEQSTLYNIVFALITGAVASFFVAVIVELSSNYRHNKLAWYELQEYYRCITHHENMKQVLMKTSPLQETAEIVRNDFTPEEKNNEDESNDKEDNPKDIVEATWAQLLETIPILHDTLKTKKAFLSDKEIEELEHIIFLYDQIKKEISRILPFRSVIQRLLIFSASPNRLNRLLLYIYDINLSTEENNTSISTL